MDLPKQIVSIFLGILKYSMVLAKAKELGGMTSLAVYLTFDPPWGKDKMSEDAKLALDIQ